MATALQMASPADELYGKDIAEVREILMERARALVPVLRERAHGTEKLGRLPEETVRDLIDNGFMRASVARQYGGYPDAEYDLTLEIAMELGRGCTSTAWCLTIWANHNLSISMLPEEVRAEYYSKGPDVISATARMCVREEMELVEDGLRLSAQYNFSSGCQHAEWFIVMGKNMVGMLLKREEVEIVENWNVVGLRGTGSHGIVVKDVVVPSNRIWGLFDAATANPPIFVRNQRMSDAVDGPMLGYTALSSVVGAAQGAVDTFVEANRGKRTDPMSDYGAGDASPTQIRLAESAAEAEIARRILLDDCRWLFDMARQGKQIDALDRARIRRNQAYVSKMAVSAATRLFDALGGRGLVDGNPQQRFFRDAVAASHHATLPKDRLFEVYGATALGFPKYRDHVSSLYHPSLVMDMFAEMMG